MSKGVRNLLVVGSLLVAFLLVFPPPRTTRLSGADKCINHLLDQGITSTSLHLW